ncbi:MAG: patatin [Gammaproteobacteria bacterium]|nr:patatin [Gammaproteobacteria bacterium]
MLLKLVLTLAVCALVQACGSLPRLKAVPPSLTESAGIPGIPDARIWVDRDIGPFIRAAIRDANREAETLEREGKPANPLPPVYALAISGGGDAGAFAAGILSGWTVHGDRPRFNVVTGISVGALIAPFAFLGPEYDDVVRGVATSVRAEDIFRKRSTLMGLASDGMASSEPLAGLVAKCVTPEILAAIAREYAKGRALQLGTTDLDAGRQVIWNMGEIASSGAPGALDLFRKIIIASSSIPGVVSPVMIDVEVDGQPFQEMHVDGGVISQLFLYPSPALAELAKATGKPLQRELHTYVIRNGRLEPDWNNTERATLEIGDRAIRALVQTQGINDVRQLYEIAQRDGADFNLAYIGRNFDQPHSGLFDPAYMKRLYEYAYDLAASGRAWHAAPPSQRTTEHP